MRACPNLPHPVIPAKAGAHLHGLTNFASLGDRLRVKPGVTNAV